MNNVQIEIYDLVVFVGLLATPVNAFALWILYKHPKVMGEIACIFHKGLAVIDLLTALSCIVFGVRVVVRDSLILAMVLTMSTLSFTLCSAQILGLICVDRFCAIRKPLRHLVLFTPTRAKIYTTTVILGSCSYMILQTTLSYFGGTKDKFDQSLTQTQALVRQLIFLLTALIVFITVVSLTILNGLLLITVVRATKHHRKLRGDITNPVSTATKTSLRVAKTVIVMTTAFYFAFIPGIVCVGLMTAGVNIDLAVIHGTFVIMQCNCLLNPFIYLVMNPAFRRVALKKFCLENWNIGESIERGSSELDRIQS